MSVRPRSAPPEAARESASTGAGQITPSTPSFWNALRGAATRRELEEYLDSPIVEPNALAGNLRDLRLMNRWLLWSRAVARDVEPLLPDGPALLLDVATGSADIPRALLARARRRGSNLMVVASDVSAEVLASARRLPDSTHLRFIHHDGGELPFRDNAVDVATCCLAAHHFAPEHLVRLLSELWRVARRGVVVSDLYRSRHGYLAARGMALVLRNPLTSHDGPVSVLRAYTPAELRALARQSGLEHIRIRRSFPVRMALVAVKDPCP